MGKEIVCTEHLPECVVKLVKQQYDNLCDKQAEALKDCESPIEQVFALELLGLESRFPEVSWFKQHTHEIFGHKYRTDFELAIYDVIFSDNYASRKQPVCEWITALIVECDGMEYHQDGNQIEHDNTRDIDFLMYNGTPTIRFTGHQILTDSYGCAGRALQLVTELNKKKRAGFERMLANIENEAAAK